MDHPYLTRRHDVARAGRALDLAKDLRTLATMSKDDHAHLVARCEPRVADADVREALTRHAGRLGMLLEDLDALADTTLSEAHGDEWSAFLTSATPLSESVWRSVDDATAKLRALREELAPVEADDASSSYSDYSDSRTVSSDEQESESEEEESEEEEELPRKKRVK